MQQRQLDLRTAYALRPLRWIAREDLIYGFGSADSFRLRPRVRCYPWPRAGSLSTFNFWTSELRGVHLDREAVASSRPLWRSCAITTISPTVTTWRHDRRSRRLQPLLEVVGGLDLVVALQQGV